MNKKILAIDVPSKTWIEEEVIGECNTSYKLADGLWISKALCMDYDSDLVGKPFDGPTTFGEFLYRNLQLMDPNFNIPDFVRDNNKPLFD